VSFPRRIHFDILDWLPGTNGHDADDALQLPGGA
jgi:hypothetical protein